MAWLDRPYRDKKLADKRAKEQAIKQAEKADEVAELRQRLEAAEAKIAELEKGKGPKDAGI